MKKSTILLSAVCALLALACSAKASTLNFNDSRDLGQIYFGTPSGDQDRTDYTNHLIGMALNSNDTALGQGYHRSGNPCGTCAPVAVGDIVNGPPGNATVPLGSGGFLYLFAKYDGKNGAVEVWNIQGMTGTITIPQNGTAAQDNKYGLSGWSIWAGGTTNTPDGGTTAALLGLGLSGLAALRARFGRK
jgi:VPDSG-CTERM motif